MTTPGLVRCGGNRQMNTVSGQIDVLTMSASGHFRTFKMRLEWVRCVRASGYQLGRHH